MSEDDPVNGRSTHDAVTRTAACLLIVVCSCTLMMITAPSRSRSLPNSLRAPAFTEDDDTVMFTTPGKGGTEGCGGEQAAAHPHQDEDASSNSSECEIRAALPRGVHAGKLYTGQQHDFVGVDVCRDCAVNIIKSLLIAWWVLCR